MPRKDPEGRRAYMATYRSHKIAEGYGKTLYARRRVKWENEMRYRKAIDEALRLLEIPNADKVEAVLLAVRKAADKATGDAG